MAYTKRQCQLDNVQWMSCNIDDDNCPTHSPFQATHSIISSFDLSTCLLHLHPPSYAVHNHISRHITIPFNSPALHGTFFSSAGNRRPNTMIMNRCHIERVEHAFQVECLCLQVSTFTHSHSGPSPSPNTKLAK